MNKKRESTVSSENSSCPLPLSPEERKQRIAAWMASMPPVVRSQVETARVVEFMLGMGPGCVGIYSQKCKAPGLAFNDALYRLAGRADIFRRASLIFDDGARLDVDPWSFASYEPGSSAKANQRKAKPKAQQRKRKKRNI